MYIRTWTNVLEHPYTLFAFISKLLTTFLSAIDVKKTIQSLVCGVCGGLWFARITFRSHPVRYWFSDLVYTSREAALQTLSCLRLLSRMKFSEQLTRTPQSKWGRAVWNKLNLRKKFPVLRTSATKKCSSRSSSGVRSSWTLTSDFLCRGHCQHGISNPYKVIYDCVISVRNPRPAWLEHPITVSLTLFRAAWFKISPNHPSEWCLILYDNTLKCPATGGLLLSLQYGWDNKILH